jgi:hypothetical protein
VTVSPAPIRWGTQLALLAGIAWLTAGPSAQGLGEIARQEAARRQQVSPGKKYTNEDALPEAPGTPLPPPAAAWAAAGSTDPVEKKDVAGAAATAEPAAPQAREKRDEKYWRDRSRTLRLKLNESQGKVKAIQQRLEQLDDALAKGAGSSHSQERAVTLKALSDAQTDYAYIKEEWTRMENRARAAKVPEEWTAGP